MRRRLVLVIGSLAAFIALAVAGVIYTNSVQREAKQDYLDAIRRSEQQWCDIIGLFDRAYQEHPPNTPLGQQVAAQMHVLYGNFGCVSSEPR